METTPNEISENDKKPRRRGGRLWVPLGLVLIGGALFLRQLGFDFPYWLFSWQVLLIFIGIVIGLSHAFRGPGWLIMILVGTFFLMDELIPGFDFHRFLWPGAIIVIGLVMLIRPKKPHWMDEDWGSWKRNQHRRWRHRFDDRRRWREGGLEEFRPEDAANTGKENFNPGNFSSDNYIDATTVLGGVHKNILSKNFKGGDITIFMGGAEINLSQADIQGTAVLDITQIMGGTKIIVPPHWEVRSQLTSFFGNVEDKRRNITPSTPEKILIIDGTSFFGGIEIRNY